MPVVAKWIDTESMILLIDYQGRWTWDEAAAANAQAAGMIAAQQPRRCDVIGSFRSGTMESVSPAIANARKILAQYPENVGLIVVVTNPIISMLASIFKGFDTRFSKNLHTVSSIEQARTLIHSDRAAQA